MVGAVVMLDISEPTRDAEVALSEVCVALVLVVGKACPVTHCDAGNT